MESRIWQSEPLILLIGNVDHEGVRSSLRHAGRPYQKKILNSRPENWQSIAELFDRRSVSVVLVKLTACPYKLIANPEYAAVADELFSRIASVPHVIYVYENLYTGQECKESEANEWAMYFGQPGEAVRRTVNDFLSRYSLNISTYTKNSEVTVLAQAFLAQCETGLLLRLYLPSGQLWANETDRLLQLFREYLTRISSVEVRLDETRTSSGVIYELHADPNRSIDIASEFEEFSHFMNLCVDDINQAQLLLRDKDIAQSSVMEILTRYAKEARRLQSDLRQAREQKVLHIRHRLESELLEALPVGVSSEPLLQLVDAVVPRVTGPTIPLAMTSQEARGFTININPQIVENAYGVIAQEISGDVSFNQNDCELLKLISVQAGAQKQELITALRELNDESAPRPGRMAAKQKIKAFLLTLGSKVTDVSIGILQSYIEKKMLGL